VRNAKRLAAGVRGKAPGDCLARRERNGVDDDIELTPFALQKVESRVDLPIDGDIQGHRELRTEGVGEGLYALLHLVVHVGEGQFGPLSMHCLRNAPRN